MINFYKIIRLLPFLILFSCEKSKNTEDNQQMTSIVETESQQLKSVDLSDLKENITLHLFDDEERIIFMDDFQVENEKKEFLDVINKNDSNPPSIDEIDESLVMNMVGEAYIDVALDYLILEALLTEGGGNQNTNEIALGLSGTKGLYTTKEPDSKTKKRDPLRRDEQLAETLSTIENSIKEHLKTRDQKVKIANSTFSTYNAGLNKEGFFRMSDWFINTFKKNDTEAEEFLRLKFEGRSKGLHDRILKSEKYFYQAAYEKTYDINFRKKINDETFEKFKGKIEIDELARGLKTGEYVVVDSKKVYPKYDELPLIRSSLFEKYGKTHPDLGGNKTYLGMLPHQEILNSIRDLDGKPVDNVFSVIEDFELTFALERNFNLKDIKTKIDSDLDEINKNLDGVRNSKEDSKIDIEKAQKDFETQKKALEAQKEALQKMNTKLFENKMKGLKELYLKRMEKEDILSSVKNRDSLSIEKKNRLEEIEKELKKNNFEDVVDIFQGYFRKNHEERYKMVLDDSMSKALGVQTWRQYSSPDRLMLTKDLMKSLAEDMAQAIKQGKKSYIHCKSGIGRSATGAVAGRVLRVMQALQDEGVRLTKNDIDLIIKEQNEAVKQVRKNMGISFNQMFNMKRALYELAEEGQGSALTKGGMRSSYNKYILLSMGALGIGIAITAATVDMDQ